MTHHHTPAVAAGLLCLMLSAAAAQPAADCLVVYSKAVWTLPFNTAFLHVAPFDDASGGKRDSLLLSSFYNVIKSADGSRVESFYERDLAAWIPDVARVGRNGFDAQRDLEVLSDRGGPPYRTVWPNKTDHVPKGVVPFNAVVVPEGFLSADKPGRLVLIDVDSPERTEYLIADAGTRDPVCRDGRVENERWFYHQALFHDMDGDGLKDIITARASFKPFLFRCPPAGELVYFRNPGKALAPGTPWESRLLLGLPESLDGPEVNLDLADLDGDGTPEIIATHFFNSDHITIFGAPAGQPWSAIDPAAGRPMRRQTVMTGQGRPFAVEAIDLNLDGRLDILTSNHQGDGCFDVTRDAIPGRVIALEQPANGRIFDEPWRTHVLKDNIRPHPTVPTPVRGLGRLAPNRAAAFWPQRSMEGREQPWIVVGGDEASKVWVLKPRAGRAWDYESFVIFDINVHYGPNTTQTLLDDPQGVKIGTIGGLTWRYDRPGANGRAEIYAPVFEARQIHVFSFRRGSGKPVICTADTTIACPAPAS